MGEPKAHFFVYFNEITENSGPLQLFPKTHKATSKVLASLRRGRNWSSLAYHAPGVLEQSVGHDAQLTSVTAAAGSLIFVDTSVLHRGKPGLVNERYSATYYAYKTPIPYHIKELVVASSKFF